MSSFVGMDITQVRSLATQLQDKANQITDIASQLTQRLGSTDWKGADAERFRSDWNGQHATALRRVAEALNQAGQLATQNAQQQEQASGN